MSLGSRVFNLKISFLLAGAALALLPASAGAFRSNIGFWKGGLGPSCSTYGPDINVTSYSYYYGYWGVRSIVSDGTTTYIGGDFDTVQGQPRKGLAAIDNVTGALLPFDGQLVNLTGDVRVNSLVLDGDILYVGGLFTGTGNLSSRFFAQGDLTTGELNPSFPEPILSDFYGNNIFGIVRAVISDGAGGWFIGGMFSEIGGFIRHGVARVNADGSIHPWEPQLSLTLDELPSIEWGPGVYSLYLDGNVLYVGGDFRDEVTGDTSLMAFDISQNTLNRLPWTPQVSGRVRTLLKSGSSVYVGGSFGAVNSLNKGSGAEFSSTGTGLLNPNMPEIRNFQYNAEVRVVIPDGAGGWYVGGDFSYVGGALRSRLARINSDGSLHSFAPSIDGPVYSLALSGTTLYVGGSFSNIDGQTRRKIAALDTTTGTATTWNPNSSGDVYSMVLSGTTLYVGGQFSSIGGQIRNRIAALDTTTGTATTWNPNSNGYVYSMVLSGTTLYVGGQFTSIGGQTRNRIAALDTTTGTATTWNPNSSGDVYSMVLSGTTLYVGGVFSSIGGQTRNRIAALDTTTGNATSWNPTSDGYIYSMVLSGTTLYVGGQFTSIGGQTRNNVAALDTTLNTNNATAWSPSGVGIVRTLSYDTNRIFIGTSNPGFGGQTRNGIAELDATTGSATSWNPKAMLGSEPGGISRMILSGTTLYVGGQFTSVGGQTRRGLAALNTTTGAATTWNPSSDGYVYSMVLSGTTLYVGGDFGIIGGKSRSRIAALNTATGTATNWNPNASGLVNSMVLSGTTLYVGGKFEAFGGKPQMAFAALDTTVDTNNLLNWKIPSTMETVMWNGRNLLFVANDKVTIFYDPFPEYSQSTTWPVSAYLVGNVRRGLAAFDRTQTTNNLTSWNPSSVDSENSIGSMVLSGTTLYVGGDFRGMGGRSAWSSIAALDTTTGTATTWSPEVDMSVYSLALSGTTLYVGGYFTSINGEMRYNIGALDTITGNVTSWDPQADGEVGNMLLSGTTLYVSGSFTEIGGQARNHIAALDTTTGTATNWNPNANSTVNEMALSGTTLYVGGLFSSIGGQVRNNIAALDTTTGNAVSWNPNANGSVFSVNIHNGRVYVGGAFTSFGGSSNRKGLAIMEVCP